MKRVRAAILGSAAAALLAGQAQAAPKQCVTPAEVESMVLVLMPDILRALGESCGAHLPRTALLSQKSAPMIARYETEAETAWPDAKAALLKIANVDDATPLMDSAFGRRMLSAFVVPELTKSIRPAQCPAVNRMIEMLEPLPARNMAGLFAAILQLAEDGKKNTKSKRSMPLCPLAAE